MTSFDESGWYTAGTIINFSESLAYLSEYLIIIYQLITKRNRGGYFLKRQNGMV